MSNAKWYIEQGEQGDVVLSTRIRLARNLDAYPFPARLDLAGKQSVNQKIKEALSESGFTYVDMKSLSRMQAISLAERHLISPEFASSREGRALLLAPNEALSIMLCEEDHIRLQVMQAGLALREAYGIANKIDTLLESKLQIAFDERIGYLTQCPTNLGTAMRASVMLHLPALTRLGQIARLANTVSKLGLTIRGAYGEGSNPSGDIYQLSNQITLGITEQAAIENLQSIALQLVQQERAAATELCRKLEEQDRIHRALGILQSARLLPTEEFMQYLSLVRMGAARGVLETPIETINELIVIMQPATLNAAQNEALEPGRRDALRAEAVRRALKGMNPNV